MNKDYKKVLAAIKKYNDIIILRHEVPDFDASGSQFGLKQWILDNYPNKHVYALGKPHKIFAPKLYPLTDTLEKLPEKYLCIVVDIANQPRIDGKEYMEKADYLIKIDHHPLTDSFGNIEIVDTTASAASEILAEMVISFKKKLTPQCAYYFYSAIVGDSGRFQYSSTSARTFNVTASLMATNFNFQDIYDKMYIKSISDIKIINYIYANCKLSPKNVAYYKVSYENMQEWGVEREAIKAFVNQFSGYEEIKIWVQFTEDIEAKDEESHWRVSIRSRGISINDVASKYHGGGHANASGAKCKDEEEMAALIADLDALL